MHRPSSLAAIITAARAGALDHAERLFREGGYEGRQEPAALAVKGRLLKDRALRLAGAERVRTLRNAAATYAAADALLPQPYTRINAASLHLLAGDRAEAEALAGQVLAWLDSGEPLAETPYFLAAIRAEALLVLGRTDEAAAALAVAMASDSGDWSDRATTLRQLRLLAAVSDGDAAWLSAYEAPASLHFAGHLGVDPAASGPLEAEIDRALELSRAGFGFGALAAGADIVVAERLLARDCELHVVLPTSVEEFLAQSVLPYGAAWEPRFEACLDAAASLTETAHVIGRYEPLATQLASEAAMGAACRNARHVDGRAVQLVVVDEGAGPYGDGLGTAVIAERWHSTTRDQIVLRAPRSAPVIASGLKASEGRSDRRLLALLRIGFAGIDELDEGQFASAVDEVLEPFRAHAHGLGAQPSLVLPAGNARLAAFATPEQAWAYARALFAFPPAALPLKIAGHYGLVHWLESPLALVGRTVAQLDPLFAAALPGVFTASEAFASSLALGAGTSCYSESVGEIDGIRLFSVTEVPAGTL